MCVVQHSPSALVISDFASLDSNEQDVVSPFFYHRWQGTSIVRIIIQIIEIEEKIFLSMYAGTGISKTGAAIPK
jgi:hypothetical protein